MAFTPPDLSPGRTSRLLRLYLELKRLTDLLRSYVRRGVPGARRMLLRNESTLHRLDGFFRRALDAFRRRNK